MKTVLVSAAVTAVAISVAGLRTLFPFQSSVAEAGTARAALRTEIAPAPAVVTAATQLGCADAVLCVGDCKKGDASCVAECEAALGTGVAVTRATALYHALVSCADEHACEGDGLCARKNCGVELDSCLGMGAPEGSCR